MKKQFIVMMASVLMLVGYGQVMSVMRHTVTDLGTSGENNSHTGGIYTGGIYTGCINSYDRAAGYSNIAGSYAQHTCLYNTTAMTNRRALAESNSNSYASIINSINKSNQVIGSDSIIICGLYVAALLALFYYIKVLRREALGL